MKPNTAELLSSVCKRLYHANPLYLISACSVLYGLQQAVAAEGGLEAGWSLTALICGYMLLLALACYAIVRWGQVWEDARSVLLVLVLVDLSLAISIDQITIDDHVRGSLFVFFGIGFSIVVCEALLAGLRIRLTAWYRLPFYLIVTLNFAFPIWLAYCVSQETLAGLARMRLGILLFPIFGAACLLTLWPAARRGAERMVPSGTPWPWPWYPWTLFIASGVTIGLRSVALAYGFEYLGSEGIGWQMYLLIPLLLASAVICLEIGISSGHERTKTLALLLPLGLVLLALPGRYTNIAQSDLLHTLQAYGLSPIQLTLYALAIYYGVNMIRQLRIAEAGFIACVAALSVVSEQTVNLQTVTFPRTWPLDLLAGTLIVIGLARQTLWRTLLGTAIGVVSLGLRDWGPFAPSQKLYYLVHAAVVCGLLFTLLTSDRYAERFRRYAHFVIPSAALAAATVYVLLFPGIPYAVHHFYVSCLTAIALIYWLRWPEMRFFGSCAICFTAMCAMQGRHAYKMLEVSRQHHGLNWLVVGIVALILATFISLTKGGLTRHVASGLHKIHGALRGTPG